MQGVNLYFLEETIMSKRSKALREGRRKFLKNAALAGGAAGVAVASRGVVAQATPEDAKAPTAPRSQGYHETQHIAEYYQKARF